VCPRILTTIHRLLLRCMNSFYDILARSGRWSIADHAFFHENSLLFSLRLRRSGSRMWLWRWCWSLPQIEFFPVFVPEHNTTRGRQPTTRILILFFFKTFYQRKKKILGFMDNFFRSRHAAHCTLHPSVHLSSRIRVGEGVFVVLAHP